MSATDEIEMPPSTAPTSMLCARTSSARVSMFTGSTISLAPFAWSFWLLGQPVGGQLAFALDVEVPLLDELFFITQRGDYGGDGVVLWIAGIAVKPAAQGRGADV